MNWNKAHEAERNDFPGADLLRLRDEAASRWMCFESSDFARSREIRAGLKPPLRSATLNLRLKKQARAAAIRSVMQGELRQLDDLPGPDDEGRSGFGDFSGAGGAAMGRGAGDFGNELGLATLGES